MAKHDEAIIALIKDKGAQTPAQVAEHLGTKLGPALGSMRKLRADGKLKSSPSTLKGHGNTHHYDLV